MLTLLWLVVMCSLSSLDKIDIFVELLADAVWEAEGYKTGFLVVEVDIFDQLFFYKRPISFPMVQNSNKNRKYDQWG